MSRKIRKTPIPHASIQWMDKSFDWLVTAFGEEAIKKRKILIPHHSDFPIRYNGHPDTAHETLAIVAAQMEIATMDIHLEFYDPGASSLSAGGFTRGNIHLQQYKTAIYAGGLYHGKQEDGKYHIWLSKEKLGSPERMVATMAHELAHVKLLGEGRLENNDEHLTDFTTVVFGLGIFNANACFEMYKTDKGWGYESAGYLKQREWGYALAMLAILREEYNPDWKKYLTKNIQSDLTKSIEYILENQPEE